MYENYFENLERYFLNWYVAALIIIGIFGNLFCVVFLIYSKAFPRTIAIWMIAIGFCDLGILLTEALRMWLKTMLQFDIRDQGNIVCASHNFLSNYFFYTSAYMQAIMSVQRLYCICYPLQARFKVTFRKVSNVVLLITILMIIPNSLYLIFWRINAANHNDCEPNTTKMYYLTTVFDTLFWGLIPLSIMTITTAIISCKMRRESVFRKSVKNKNSGGTPKENTAPTEDKLSCIQLNEDAEARSDCDTLDDVKLNNDAVEMKNKDTTVTNRASTLQKHGGSQNKSSSSVTRLLMIINLFYMLTTYPLLIYFLILNFYLGNNVGVTISQKLHVFIYYLLRSICFLNCSFNWRSFESTFRQSSKKAN